MIYCLITREHDYTVRTFLQTWGRRAAHRVRLIYYNDLVRWRRLPVGTYLFTDLERLTNAQMRLARHAAGRLEREAGQMRRPDGSPLLRILNDPRRILLRYDLLRALHDRGVNPFRPWRMAELDELERLNGSGGTGPRFPVFLRREDEHDGSLSPLLQDRRELSAAVEEAVSRGVRRQSLLAVEFCDVRDAQGWYGKYATLRVGSEVFPHHFQVSQHWVNKRRKEEAPWAQEVEAAFMTERPHDAQMGALFDLAQIDYGRADYALLDGRIVLWEINTNPMLLNPPDQIAPERLVSRAQVARWVTGALEAMDQPPPAATNGSGVQTPMVDLCVPADLAAELGYGPRSRAQDAALRFLRKSWNGPAIRPVTQALRRLRQGEPWVETA